MIEFGSTYIESYEKVNFTEGEYDSTHQEAAVALTSTLESRP